MKKITIQPGCISCGSCEYIAPEVFEVTDISRVKKDANLAVHEETIKKAAQACPVQVITYEE
jgi:ferredoxin